MLEKPNSGIKPLHMCKNISDLKKEADKSEVLRNRPVRKITELTLLIYKKAKQCLEDGDEEQAYIFFMRCISMISYLKSTDDYKADQTYYHCMLGKEGSDSINILLHLDKKLRDRYEQEYGSCNEEIREFEAHKSNGIRSNEDSTQISIHSERIDKNFSKPEEDKEKQEEENRRTSISSKELLSLSQKHPYSVLVIDIRPKEFFNNSRMNINTVINIPPNLITPGITGNKLAHQMDDEYQSIFRDRARYDYVVLTDENSGEKEFVMLSPLYMLYVILTKWAVGINCKRDPVILQGGYIDWLYSYPTWTTNPKYHIPSESPKPSSILSSIDYPVPLIDEEKPPIQSHHPVSSNDRYITSVPSLEKPSIINHTINNKNGNGTVPSFDRSKKPTHIPEKQLFTDAKMILDNERVAMQVDNVNDEECDNLDLSSPSYTFENPASPVINNIIKDPSFDVGVDDEARRYCRKERRSGIFIEHPSEILPSNASEMEIEENENIYNEGLNHNHSSVNDEIKPAHESRKTNFTSCTYDNMPSSFKRSSSTPNIKQINDDTYLGEKPFIDRSTKPSVPEHFEIRDFCAVYGNDVGRGLTGLKNLGNTCYMNSIIQCLSNTQLLRNDLLMLSLVPNRSSKTNGKIAEELRNIIRHLWSGDVRSISPKGLKTLVGNYRETFRGYEQQDSHEFLTILIDWLHEDLKNPERPICLDGADEKTGEKSWGEFIKKNDSIIRTLFYGQQKSTVTCRMCGKESITFEPFSNLSLPLPISIEKCSLHDCLQLYLKGECISGWQCPECKAPREATKKLDITKLPPILVIHFKRFTSDGWCRKRQTMVDFPIDVLNMNHCILPGEHRNSYYSLYAVSNHYGTMESGHYTAYCKNSERWYRFDDQDVSLIGSEEIRSSAAYIVFYVRK